MDKICLTHGEASALLVKINALRAQLADGTAPDTGLCGGIGIRDNERQFLFADWPEYTGLLDFPVPAPSYMVVAPYHESVHRTAYMNHDDMFSGEYGAARLRLLDHIEAKLRALV